MYREKAWELHMIAMRNRKLDLLPRLLLAATLLLLAAGPAVAALPRAGDGGIVFTLDDPAAVAVFLAGDFNGWNATATPLARNGEGQWSATVALAPGSYEYKFVVDDQWLEDPANPERKSDPFGGANSVLTIAADGSVAGAAGAAATAAATSGAGNAASAAAPADMFKVGAPRAVAGGVLFTFRADGAGRVTLAGTFNGWNADDTPLETDGKGNWAVVRPLKAGSYEYKFVADGNWQADPANPDTASDPYGGTNSVVTVDGKGRLIAAPVDASAAAATGTGLQGIETRATIDGRYLTRFEYAKNVPVSFNDQTTVDPRFRLQRPTQSVDLNVRTEVSNTARTLMRLRMDSDQNIIQNNVAAFLDEAYIEIHPETFNLRAYWNQEVFTGEDLLHLGGDIDLPGTIMHDHIDAGKGSAGALFTADPLGIRTRIYLANVHNYDYYNDPELYDNIGQDRFSMRLSRRFGNLTVGLPLYVNRALTWLDFGGLTTGTFPTLDDHRNRTGDNSTWYEVDNTILNGGLDLSYTTGGDWTLGAEALYNQASQDFVTGNQAGQDNVSNGAVEVPIINRETSRLAAQLDYRPEGGTGITLQHEMSTMSGADAEERYLVYTFQPQSVANKQFLWALGATPASVDQDSTELRVDWGSEESSVSLWLRHAGRDYDYAAIGATAPEDSTVSSYSESIWYLAGKAGFGSPGSARGRVELETVYTAADRGVAGMTSDSFETILRYDRDLTRNVGFIADLRWIAYSSAGTPDGGTGDSVDTDFFNPFVGMRYTPIRQLQLVLAYGVDPLDYSIDYGGRQIGRWMYRQNYLWDHPDATNLDAENALKNARVITMRIQMTF